MVATEERVRGVKTAVYPYILGALTGIVVVGLGIFFFADSFTMPEEVPIEIRPLTKTDHLIGTLDAPVQLISYFNPECEFCRSLHEETLPAITKEYGALIVTGYRYMYLPRFSQSRTEMHAIECAATLKGETGFWDYFNRVIAKAPEAFGLSESELKAIARELAIPLDKFDTCRSEEAVAKRVSLDTLEASRVDIVISPTTVVRRGDDMIFVVGDSRAQLRAAIHTLLPN